MVIFFDIILSLNSTDKEFISVVLRKTLQRWTACFLFPDTSQCITYRSLSSTQEGKQTLCSGHDHGGSARTQTNTHTQKKIPTNRQQLTAAGATQDLTVSDMEPLHTLGRLVRSSHAFFFFLNAYTTTRLPVVSASAARKAKPTSPSLPPPAGAAHVADYT